MVDARLPSNVLCEKSNWYDQHSCRSGSARRKEWEELQEGEERGERVGGVRGGRGTRRNSREELGEGEEQKVNEKRISFFTRMLPLILNTKRQLFTSGHGSLSWCDIIRKYHDGDITRELGEIF